MALIKRFFILNILILFVQMAFSKSNEDAYFQKGERVCFVGNSITNNGEFHHNILLYYITRFPKKEVTFYNCGVSGDVTGGILSRMEDDILSHKPSTVVLMIGMNDVRRSLYADKATTNKDTLALRQKAIDIYTENLEKIINVLLTEKINIILQKPSIYDQTALISTPNNLGVNNALKICADFVESLGVKYKLSVVDYWTVLNKTNTELQQKDSTATIVGNDRVHPGASGHFIMAYEFLKTQKLPSLVSHIFIDSKSKKTDKSYNCSIQDLNIDIQQIKFKVRENALPFPTISTQSQALKLVAFSAELNRELLQISNLKSGNYCLYIDDTLIGKFSDIQLSEGVNLSLFSNTPQFQQALKVRNVLLELWKLEAQLRSIKFIEYCNDIKQCLDKSNPEAVVNYLRPIFDKKNSTFYTMQLNNYAANKKNEADLIQKSDELRKKAYIAAQPTEHTFRIVPESK